MLVFAQGENLDFILQCGTHTQKNTCTCFEIKRTRMEAIRENCQFIAERHIPV